MRPQRTGALVLLGSALYATGVSTGSVVLVLAGASSLLAAALVRAVPGDVLLPVALLSLLLLASAAGVVADALSVDLLAAPPQLLIAGLLLLPLSTLRRPTESGPGRPRATCARSIARAALTWSAPIVAAAGSLLQETVPRLAPSWALLGTDIAQHALGLRAVQVAGQLDYAADAYPRGLHMLVALAMDHLAQPDGPAAAEQLVRVWASVTWLALAVLLALAVPLTRALCGTRSPWLSAAACAGMGWTLLLWNRPVDVFLHMGAAPTLLAVSAVWLVPLAARRAHLARLDMRRLLLGVAVATALVAHLWQPLVVVPLLSGAALWLASRRRGTAGRLPLVSTACAAAAVTVVAVPPLLGVLQGGGTAIAALPGELAAPPVLWLSSAVAMLVVVARRGWDEHEAALAGSGVALVAVAALLLDGAGNGLDLTQYYPRKVLWILALTVGPLTAVACCLASYRCMATVWSWLAALGAATRVARVTFCAALAAAAFALLLPQAVAVPSSALESSRALWQDAEAETLSEERLRLGLDYADRFAPAVSVPVGLSRSAVFDRTGTAIVSRVMALRTGQPQSGGALHNVCEDIRTVAGDSPVVVVTKIDREVVRKFLADGGCPGARVHQVPGQIRDVDALLKLAERG